MTLKLLKGAYFKIALLALAALSAAGALASWASAFSLGRQTRAAVAVAEEASRPAPAAEAAPEGGDAKPADAKKGSKAARKAAREAAQIPPELETLVKDKGLFGKANTVVIVQGILDKKALINGQWLSVGQEQNGIKLVEFDEKRAVVEVAGETKEVPIWTPLGGFVPKKGSRGSIGGLRGGTSFSSSEREEMRKRYQGMSESERQAFRDRMRQQYGGGRGGSGGGMNQNRQGSGREDRNRNSSNQDRSDRKKIR